MVTRWGMSDKLGMVQLAPPENPFLENAPGFGGGEKPFGERTAELIDSEVQRIIEECHQQAKSLLTQHRRQLDALVAALLDHETLDQEEILRVTGLPAAPDLQHRVIAAAEHHVAA
jgi:cell division protease FtsH